MPRRLSSEAVRSLLKESTTETFLLTMKVSGEGFADLHLVNNLENIVIGNNTYFAFPFQVILPNESKDKPPKASIRIDNLSQVVIRRLRAVQGRPTFELAVRLASTPEVIELGPIALDSSNADWDDTWIQLTLSSINLLNEPFPYRTFSPVTFPGLFQ